MYTSFFTDSEPSLDGQVVSINWLIGGLGHGGYRDTWGYTENLPKKTITVSSMHFVQIISKMLG